MPQDVLVAFVVAGIAMLITNAFWFRAKFLLRQRGFPVSFFVHHWQDLAHLKQWSESTDDPAERIQSDRLRRAIFTSLIVSLALFVVFFGIASRQTSH